MRTSWRKLRLVKQPLSTEHPDSILHDKATVLARRVNDQKRELAALRARMVDNIYATSVPELNENQ